MDYYLFRNVQNIVSPVCGCAMLNPGWCHMKRCLKNESVLIFGRKGSAGIYVGSQYLEIKPGKMILLPAGLEHYGANAVDKPVSYYWLHFVQDTGPEKIEEGDALTVLSSPAIAYQRFSDSIILPLELNVANTHSFENLFTSVLAEFQKPGFSKLIYNNLVERLLLEFSGECFKNPYLDKDLKGARALVQKVFFILESELSNPNASVKFFADKLNVNSDYLGRVFKEAVHLSLGSYLTGRRVELACCRLRESNESIEKIAFQCGFGSRRQFYQEFKNFTGKTPAAYRRQSSFIGTNTL